MEEKSVSQAQAISPVDIIAGEGDRAKELPLKSGFQLVWELAH